MEKEGKVDIWSVLIASILILIVYAVMVLGGTGIDATFPENNTNASATFGYSPSALNATFNGTLPQFHCTVRANGSDATNITNASLYISTEPLASAAAIKNQTLNTTIIGTTAEVIIFNTTAFNEGVFWWFCEAENNVSGTINYNSTLNRTFTIDKSPPGFNNLTNTSNTKVSTGDTIYIYANFTDRFTSIHTVRLFVNSTGTADNEVNTTGGDGSNGVTAGNNTQVNLSFVILGSSVGDVLNFTLQVNDSVNNINITSAIIFSVDGDGTPPGINLTSPIPLFNQSSATAPDFSFIAVDNNKTASLTLTCGINISLGGSLFTDITNIKATNGTLQTNTTSVALSNGTYNWNVSCTDPAGNKNTSLTQSFTVDQIAPIGHDSSGDAVGNAFYYNFTDKKVNATDGTSAPLNGTELGLGDGLSTAQGRQIFGIGNFTDNLTQVIHGRLQFYNTSIAGSDKWQTLNQSVGDDSTYKAFNNDNWINFSFTIPIGRNEFEGRNVSFRIVANDTLGNINTSLSVKNFTIQINDTFVPTIIINGTISVNDTNSTNTRPIISWAVDENNKLTSINVSVDGLSGPATGVESNCQKSAFFDTTAGTNNVEKFRNFSFQVKDDPACTLVNGTHFVNVTAVDAWGNSVQVGHVFSIQTGSVPGLVFNLTNLDSTGSHIKASVNNSNITSRVGIQLFGANGVGASIDKISYFTSCNSTIRVVNNYTTIFPFNKTEGATCETQSENRTLTVTINDTAGNFNTTVLGFLVDNVGPTFTLLSSPSNGENFVDTQTLFNFSVLDDDQAIAFYGYYLDDNDLSQNTTINLSASIGAAGFTISDTRLVNLTPGTHTIKFTANDTLGNVGNSSVITFTQIGPIVFGEVNKSIEDYIAQVFNNNLTNVSVRIKTDAGTYDDITAANSTNNTFEILYQIDGAINVSLTEINGSAANWDKINFTPYINRTKFEVGVQKNWTNLVLNSTWFNNSINEFIGNNDYYGVVVMPFNISNGTFSDDFNTGNTSTAQEFWWFADQDDLTTRTNISQCTGGFSRTTTTPCWNYTTGGRTIIQVPHFSMVLAVNDTTQPSVTVNSPADTVRISGVVPNITVSFDVSTDVASCEYKLNITDSTKVNGQSANVSGSVTAGKVGGNNICSFSEVRFKNGVYNITWNVTDANGNINISSSGDITTFTMADNTAPDTGTSIDERSITSTTASVLISGVNESVNATVLYGTSVGSLGSSKIQTSFSKSPSVSLTGLSASTKYFYNVTLRDFNGNTVRNGTFNFTTSSAGTTTTTTTTTTSGGGGGAASVSNVADSKAQVWSVIPSGSSVSLNVDKATIAITSVAVNNVKSELKNVDIEVQALKSNPVSATAAGKVFQYIKINKKQIVDGDAETIKIGFRVTKTWLTDNGLTSADVRLYRYKNSVWNKLSTSVKSTDSTYVNFEAETPGFSFFAVGSATGGGDAFAIIDAIRGFYDGTSSLTAFEIIDMIRAFYG